MGDLTMQIRPAIPRVDLEAPAGIREIDEPIGFIPSPRRESEPRRAVATLPRDLGRGHGLSDRHDSRVYWRSQITTRRRGVRQTPSAEQDPRGAGVGFRALANKGRKRWASSKTPGESSPLR